MRRLGQAAGSRYLISGLCMCPPTVPHTLADLCAPFTFKRGRAGKGALNVALEAGGIAWRTAGDGLGDSARPAPLARERSRVQSSLAAPSIPLEESSESGSFHPSLIRQELAGQGVNTGFRDVENPWTPPSYNR
jgi:hypothetical protein